MLKFVRAFLRLAARAVVRPTGRVVLLGDLGRLSLSLLAFASFAVGTIYLLPVSANGLEVGVAAGWVAASAVYLSLTWAFLVRSDAMRTTRWARSEDAPRSRILQTVVGRTAGLGFVVLASLAGLASGTGLLDPTTNGGSGLLTALSALGVIGAWAILQTSYALYYAYLYYREDPADGVEFPGGEEPDLLDFAYFAFTVATAFAVSDVRVSSRRIRRIVLGQSVLSFAYNAAILTLAFGAFFGGL